MINIKLSIILLLNYTKGLLFWLTYEETIGKASSAHTRVAVKCCRIFTCQMHTLLPEWITSSSELNPKTRITLADVGRWFNQLLRDHEARNNHDYLLHTLLYEWSGLLFETRRVWCYKLLLKYLVVWLIFCQKSLHT